MKRHYLLYVLAWCFVLSLPAVATASKYESDVTKKYPRVQYGPQTTMYREQCERWSMYLMWERNKLNRNRDRARWQRSWDTYTSNLLWCQQLPTYDEMYPGQKQQLLERRRVANDNR